MKYILMGFVLSTSVAFAASAPISYHDGTLVSAAQAPGCSSAARPQQACDYEYQAQYLIQTEGIVYSLTPDTPSSGSLLDRAALVWDKFVNGTSSLYRQMPGTPLKVRDNGRRLFVKVGHHESRYIAIGAANEQVGIITAQTAQP